MYWRSLVRAAFLLGVYMALSIDEPLWSHMPLCDEVKVLLPAARAGPVLDLSRLSREHLVYVSDACPVGESNPQVGGRLDDALFAVGVTAFVGVSLENCEATRVAGLDLPWEGVQALLDVANEANDVFLG